MESALQPRAPAPAVAPIGRLAPSPTGALHLGHARSFLLAWLHTRSRGGRVVLRIEDLDQERCKPQYVEQARRDIAWLGLDWDGPVHVQSEHAAALHAAAAELVERGLAYACTCTRKEIAAALSAPHGGDEQPYPGTCRDRYRDAADARAQSGLAPALRLRVADGPIEFDDDVYGRQVHAPAREVGDFVIARRDGAIAYQLAVVVDDARAGVTEVVRGADLLPSTARQILLQRALQLSSPRWAHLPLVVDDAGQRLAKRTGAFALTELRARGVDPRAIVAWALQSSGLPAPERITAVEALPAFALAQVGTKPVRWGAAELARLLELRT
jgi:glutamyl-tRNA synthetase